MHISYLRIVLVFETAELVFSATIHVFNEPPSMNDNLDESFILYTIVLNNFTNATRLKCNALVLTKDSYSYA